VRTAVEEEATNMSDSHKKSTSPPSGITRSATRALETSINESDAAMRVLRRMNHDPVLVSRVRNAQDILYTVLFEITRNPESPGEPLMPPPPTAAPVETRVGVDPKDMRAIREHDYRMKQTTKMVVALNRRLDHFEKMAKRDSKNRPATPRVKGT
jgi:hypothetical protein